MPSVPADTTSSLTRLSPWPTTTTPTRFLLDLGRRLSLRLKVFPVGYCKTSSLSETCFLSPPASAK
ncbi:hypothetical protein CLIM01_15112 [Colletotrichum limetticola]|uniref:Uncharacterized protein n=1 Tax=Colletotrichum limetticola TaxID=1209924 RepID=A0ABQ9PAV8_9PEZI|nr:hypothetical protein CLIM01_15112 [Colletotrichum limetticola]